MAIAEALEKAGFPRELLNFTETGEYYYSKEAQLRVALFPPF